MTTHAVYHCADITQLPATASDVLLSSYDKGREFGSDDLEALGELPNLRRLSLQNARRLDDRGLARIAALCPSLEHLSLGHADVTTRGLEHIATLPRLSSVTLWDLSRVRTIGSLSAAPLRTITVRSCKGFNVSSLAGAAGLTHVSLVQQGTKRAHIAALSKLPALERLEVYGYGSDLQAGAVAELSSTSLQTLHISRPLSAAEVAAVGALPALSLAYLCVDDVASLERLAPLSGGPALRLHFADIEKITDELLSRIPEILPGLEGLNLDQGQVVNRGQKFGAEGIQAIGRLSELRYLNLYRGGVFKNPDIAPLAALSKLEGLNLHGCTRLTAGAVKTIAALGGLKRLNLSSIRVSDSSLKKLAALPLEALYVHDTKITDKGAIAIAKCATLKRLAISFGKVHIEGAGLTALASLPLLEELDLNIGAVSPESFAALARCPQLKRVRLEGDLNSSVVSDAHLAALSASESLESLSLGMYVKLSVTDAGLLALSSIPSLGEVSLRASPTAETVAALRGAGVRFLASEHAPFDSYVRSGVWDVGGAR